MLLLKRLAAKLGSGVAPFLPPRIFLLDLGLPAPILAASTVDLVWPVPQEDTLGFDCFSLPSISPNHGVVRNGLISVDVASVEVSVCDLECDRLSSPRRSRNLARRIEGADTAGTVYAELSPNGSFEAVVDTLPSSRHNGFRVAFVEGRPGGRVDVLRRIGVWDQILPRLQPGLDLEAGESCGLAKPLYPYQIEGVRFLSGSEAALLGDDMGTGKTVQAVVALRALFQRGVIASALVIAPLSVLRHWDRHLEEWAPHLAVSVVRGSRERRQGIWEMPAHIWVTTYDTLRNDLDTVEQCKGADGFDLVLLDEVQKIKNPESGYSKSVRKIKASWRWGCSGTPLENQVEDVASIFAFLKPGLFGRYWTGPPHEVRERIRPFFLRRKKEHVLKELPPKQVLEEWIALEDKQREHYDRAEEEGIVYLKSLGQKVRVRDVLVLITKLKQLCNVDHETGESAKAEWLADFFEELDASSEKAVVFSQFLESGIHWLSQKFADENLLVYSGKLSESERHEVVKAFQTDPNPRVLLMSRAGGLGIELTAASYVVHFDHWWNPATMSQAEDRVHRRGQTKQVFVYHLWTEGTVEERIYRILDRKKRLYAQVIDTLSTVEGTGLSEDELFELFGIQNPRKEKKNPPESREKLPTDTGQGGVGEAGIPD